MDPMNRKRFDRALARAIRAVLANRNRPWLEYDEPTWNWPAGK